MLCQFLLYSVVTQSYIYICSFSHTIFHHVQSQETGYSSLSCTVVRPHCLSILDVIVCTYQPQTPHPSHSLLSPGFSLEVWWGWKQQVREKIQSIVQSRQIKNNFFSVIFFLYIGGWLKKKRLSFQDLYLFRVLLSHKFLSLFPFFLSFFLFFFFGCCIALWFLKWRQACV